MNNIDIIPVTHVIREYIKDNKDNKYIFNKDEYENYKLKIILNSVINNKSDIWIYQELIRNGYSNFINKEDDIYNITKLAYIDVKKILEAEGEVGAIEFEKEYVLNGNRYKNIFKNNKRVLKK